MFLHGLFSFRACAQVACELRVYLNFYSPKESRTVAWTRDRNYDTSFLDDDRDLHPRSQLLTS